jgi:hypothetical protein
MQMVRNRSLAMVMLSLFRPEEGSPKEYTAAMSAQKKLKE